VPTLHTKGSAILLAIFMNLRLILIPICRDKAGVREEDSLGCNFDAPLSLDAVSCSCMKEVSGSSLHCHFELPTE
jgi:hypothetical protein